MNGEWLRKNKSNTTIVFVHGILSSASECWKNKNGTFWPDLVVSEDSITEAGVYLFSYNTGVFSGDYNLNDVVDSFKEQLKLDNVLQNGGHIVFVCHSMGGIVARKFIVDQQLDIYVNDIRATLFLIASPSLGSGYANWIAPFGNNSQAEALKFSDSNQWLNDLDRSFKNLKEKNRYLGLSGKELIEDKPLSTTKWLGLKKKIVEPISGAKYFGEAIKVPKSDHSSISKPSDSQSFQHRLLCRFIDEEVGKPLNEKNIIKFHGKKNSVPGGNDWWNSLLSGANKRFFLIGESNKSWVNKDEEQKITLANAIVRILGNGGEVKILSTSNEIVPHTIDFIRNYVYDVASTKGIDLSKYVGKTFVYSTSDHTNYNAVISDDKLILMPTLNTRMFRNDCMVLEIDQKSSKSTFNNYIADIERKFGDDSRPESF